MLHAVEIVSILLAALSLAPALAHLLELLERDAGPLGVFSHRQSWVGLPRFSVARCGGGDSRLKIKGDNPK